VRVDVDDVANKRTIRVGKKPRGVAVGYGSVWVANSTQRTITRINPRKRKAVQTIKLQVNPTRVATGGGGVWVTARYADQLIRIDPGRREVRERARTGSEPYALDVVSGGAVWVTLLRGNGVQRIKFHP
jgi:streptogramin lyase